MPHKYQYAKNHGAPCKSEPATDLTRWQLTCVKGRQTWSYIPQGEKVEQTLLEKHSLGLETCAEAPPLPRAKTAHEAAYNAVKFYSRLQAEDGHWAGDYGGPLFLLPGLVIACYMTNTPLKEEEKAEMIRYLRSVKCPDGGWGLHTAGPPTVLGCALNYCAMRLMGIPSEDEDLKKTRSLLNKLGGTCSIPSWGKFWLALLNVYQWEGLHNLCPEMWLLPEWLPVHPSKMWCHCRQVHLAMSYCYGTKMAMKENDVIRELRQELYSMPYDKINWAAQRNNISEADLNTPHSWLLDSVYYILDWYEIYHKSDLRKTSLEEIYKHVVADDSFTNSISVGPMSKLIQMIVRWHHDGPDNEQFQQHQDRIRDYLWMGVDGMKMNATNGSQLWDTSFAVQAIIENELQEMEEFNNCLDAAHRCLKQTQIQSSPSGSLQYYRTKSRGGFPFSTSECGWIVADCTAEGLKTLMLMQEKCDFLNQDVSPDSMQKAVDALLNMRNKDGGFSTYEETRGGWILELLNPSEVFGDIMIDYTYVECTSACMQALRHYTNQFRYRQPEIMACLIEGFNYIKRKQRPDGSWYGSWGVCFTYGTWHGLEAFAVMGYKYDLGNVPKELAKACEWLVEHRLQDGGWGEKFESCEMKKYVPADKSQIVNTAWALLGLMAVNYPDVSVIEGGIKLLMERQKDNGDFPQENVMGVFNKNCAIHYDSYRNVFPIWAIGRFCKKYPNHQLARKQDLK